jgi:hypothetical protein
VCVCVCVLKCYLHENILKLYFYFYFLILVYKNQYKNNIFLKIFFFVRTLSNKKKQRNGA